jgi:large repetitive protein
VRVRGTDQHDLVTTDPPARSVTVTQPANNKPVAVIDPPVCSSNVCQFDGKHSTDENTATLTYAWNFGNNGAPAPNTVSGGSGTGPNPKKTFTAAGTYTVTLTVKDQWGQLSDPVTTTVTIAEPGNNAAPGPVVFNDPSCSGLTCNFSAVGTVDPNPGDSISYSWSFGDPTSPQNTRTGSATSHLFTAGGTYTVTLTATDGWGKATTVSKPVTVTAP